MISIPPVDDRAHPATLPGVTERVARKVAIARAQLGPGPWGALSPSDRGRLLSRLADLVDRDAALFGEMTPRDESRSPVRVANDAAHAATILRVAVGWANSLAHRTVTAVPLQGASARSFTALRPIGVVAALMSRHCALPFIARKAAALLAAGCTLVLKPSERSPHQAIHFSTLCREAGFPDGVVSVVAGRGDVVGRALCEHPDVALVSFAGSPEAGLEVQRNAALRCKPIELDLRGVRVHVVFTDAAIADAVSGCAAELLAGRGSFHTASRRVLIQRSLSRRFAVELAAAGVEAGPGPVPPQGRPVAGADSDVRARGRDVGPDVAIVEFDTEAEALALIDEYANVFGVTFWTTSRQRADRLVDACPARRINVNWASTSDMDEPVEDVLRARFGSSAIASPALAYVRETVVTTRSTS
ncbi:MAG TPA: aldehyde dehydrogenase family protein [Burkholderiaceae bacterium]